MLVLLCGPDYNYPKLRQPLRENNMFTNNEKFDLLLTGLETAMQMYSKTGDDQYADLVVFFHKELDALEEKVEEK